jgi:hypothetical protein
MKLITYEGEMGSEIKYHDILSRIANSRNPPPGNDRAGERNDDSLTEKYLMKKRSATTLMGAMRAATIAGKIHRLCGSALKNKGVRLLDRVVDLLPCRWMCRPKDAPKTDEG